MRSADKTKLECLSIWNKHKEAINETIDKAKTKEVDGNTHVCQLKLNIDKLWTNEQKLAYIEKMILTIENSSDYDK
jgi:hypothetical protein